MFDALTKILNDFSQVIILVLEIFGVLIIVLGSFRSGYLFFKDGMSFHNPEVKITLGEALALSLEFKLGAEIIKTVLLHTLGELVILAFVIVLRVLLTFVIHWEVKHADEKKVEADKFTTMD